MAPRVRKVPLSPEEVAKRALNLAQRDAEAEFAAALLAKDEALKREAAKNAREITERAFSFECVSN